MKSIVFILKSTLIGIISFFIVSAFTDDYGFNEIIFRDGRAEWFEFIIASFIIGAFVLGLLKGLIPEIKKAPGEIMEEINKFNRDMEETWGSCDIETSENKPKKKKKEGFLSSMGKVVAGTAAANAVLKPIVIPLNGGVVHGMVPRGMMDWEIQYSVPGHTGTHKTKVSRGTTGFSHGGYQFRVEWPKPFV